jgi:type IV pilus assembly protein PilA
MRFIYTSTLVTPNNPEPPSNPQPPKKSNNLLIGFLVGCGCLSFGVVALGVIAAVSLPSFLNQADRARTSEATSNIGTLLRAQQAHFLEQGKFATAITQLDARITPKFYEYKLMPSVDGLGAVVTATPIGINIEPYLPGVVGVIYTDKAGDNASQKICINDDNDQSNPTPPRPPKPPAVAGGTVICLPGSKPAD